MRTLFDTIRLPLCATGCMQKQPRLARHCYTVILRLAVCRSNLGRRDRHCYTACQRERQWYTACQRTTAIVPSMLQESKVRWKRAKQGGREQSKGEETVSRMSPHESSSKLEETLAHVLLRRSLLCSCARMSSCAGIETVSHVLASPQVRKSSCPHSSHVLLRQITNF